MALMKNSLKKKNFFLPILLFFLITSIFALAIAFYLFQPVNSADQSTANFVIPKGQSTQQIAKRLYEANLIRSTYVFRFVVYQSGLQNKIQAGSYKLSPSLSIWQLSQALTKGTDDIWITLPEGWRREEIAESLIKQDLNFFDEEEFLDLTRVLEGQLFPDTYLVSKAVNTQALVNLFYNTFESKIILALEKELKQNDLTLNQVLTLASLIQREAGDDDNEMPLIAGVLFNRLNLGMALQIDASLQYAKGFDKNQQSWWPKPSASDKNLSSPYNTYQNVGLPPAPICNPGLKAVEAALNPQATSALYYIHDLSGEIHLAETLEAHNKNINQYLR